MDEYIIDSQCFRFRTSAIPIIPGMDLYVEKYLGVPRLSGFARYLWKYLILILANYGVKIVRSILIANHDPIGEIIDYVYNLIYELEIVDSPEDFVEILIRYKILGDPLTPDMEKKLMTMVLSCENSIIVSFMKVYGWTDIAEFSATSQRFEYFDLIVNSMKIHPAAILGYIENIDCTNFCDDNFLTIRQISDLLGKIETCLSKLEISSRTHIGPQWH